MKSTYCEGCLACLTAYFIYICTETHYEKKSADCSTYCEGCLACLTAYFIYICTETHYEKHLRKVSKFIATQNERVYNPRGIHITDPILRGLRVIEITIIDLPNSPTGNNMNSRHT
ncbi:putative golgin subfamily protein a member 7/erf4 family [Operophtera brumata]|uniref:Ras modification protein ERF4 n=1 Tax=Operophtera brumata TaxID=104452 RepID=A0A0L7KPQ2_OPEBR|nr:putative golgin subfamily protein a member 7/erf4 family [Operophtera brumata]